MAPVTDEDLMRVPKDGRKFELVDRRIVETPACFEQSVLVASVGARLYRHAKGRGVVTGPQAGFRMVSGNIRCPDVSFTRKERLPGGRPPKGFLDGAPDLAIEILSPTEDFLDLPRKVAEYFASGATQVWLLEPDARRATIYHSPVDATTYGPDDEMDAGNLLPGFHCRTAELFEIE